MGKRGAKPKGNVDIVWRPELAYAVGLITSDGSLSINGRHITLTSKDYDQLATFRSCLGLTHINIGTCTAGNRRKYFRIQFGDVLFYRWLQSIGLMTNKSKQVGPLKIPDEYFFDFFRGCFDGDGSIYSYWDPRWRDSYMFYIGIASASKPFLCWLQEQTFRLSNIKGHISYGKNVWQLRFAKKEAKIIFVRMFYNPAVPYLERKFAKAQEIFRIDDDHIHNDARVV